MDIKKDLFETLPASARLWFLSLAFADLAKSESAARSAIQFGANRRVESPLCDSLVEIAVVRYAKPHKGSNLPNGKDRVRLPACFIPADEQSRRLHSLLIDTRDTSMAHSDMTVREARITRLLDRHGQSLWQGLTSSNTLDPITLSQLPDLCCASRALMLPVIRALADEIMPDAAAGQMFELLPDRVRIIEERRDVHQ